MCIFYGIDLRLPEKDIDLMTHQALLLLSLIVLSGVFDNKKHDC